MALIFIPILYRVVWESVSMALIFIPILYRVVWESVSMAECLISSYGTPLAQRASYLPLHSSLFGPDGAFNYDYIITNSTNCLLIGSRCKL